MNSIIATFALILVFFVINSFEESIKRRICNQSIDSAVTPLDTEYVYITSDDLFYKLQIISSDESKIKSVMKLKDFSEEIEAPIETIYWTKVRPKDITLTNCIQKKDYIIRYEDNEYIGSEPALLECWHWQYNSIVEYIVEPTSGGQHFLSYKIMKLNGKNEKILGFKKFATIGNEFPILWSNSENNKIIINTNISAEYRFNETFSGFYGKEVSSAFIHDKHWYLFSGRYYCRVKLNDKDFEECVPQLISHWIKDCSDDSEEESNESQNTDISLFIIILFLIVGIAVIVFFVILIYIFREVSKQSTKKTGQSSGSSGTTTSK